MPPPRIALLADDDEASRRLLGRWLEQHGWEVKEAEEGKSLLELAKQHKADLILLDLRMPGPVDGLTAASLLRRMPELAQVPIIAVSASPYKMYRQRAFEAGCTAFLSKPVRLKDLLQQINSLLGGDP